MDIHLLVSSYCVFLGWGYAFMILLEMFLMSTLPANKAEWPTPYSTAAVPTFLALGTGFVENNFSADLGRDGFTHNLDPTHVQMKFCLLARRLCNPVPNRPSTGPNPQPGVGDPNCIGPMVNLGHLWKHGSMLQITHTSMYYQVQHLSHFCENVNCSINLQHLKYHVALWPTPSLIWRIFISLVFKAFLPVPSNLILTKWAVKSALNVLIGF